MENEALYVKIELTEDGFVLSGNINQEHLPDVFRMVAEEMELAEGQDVESDEVGELH